jgi:hypothetical protein
MYINIKTNYCHEIINQNPAPLASCIYWLVYNSPTSQLPNQSLLEARLPA